MQLRPSKKCEEVVSWDFTPPGEHEKNVQSNVRRIFELLEQQARAPITWMLVNLTSQRLVKPLWEQPCCMSLCPALWHRPIRTVLLADLPRATYRPRATSSPLESEVRSPQRGFTINRGTQPPLTSDGDTIQQAQPSETKHADDCIHRSEIVKDLVEASWQKRLYQG